ncbi:glycosyltransferase [Acuticoccus sp. I52.16.1]|uniref:glycosyltransferase n=1 Tax=Acuticoccus sp. I52.16.1 TaxID=2928472 RepID=UPI001FD5D02A|nr:glycosyltransferase [Acuticoccus sp. I52.16.1]UOM34735.1 glycosyltransferase [Acuticoccus sp. I52.16.1]
MKKPGQLSIGTKNLSLDPVWSQPPITDIEFALLRNAALPEIARTNGLDHEIVIVDPSTDPDNPAHDDLATRLTECARRLSLRTVVIGHRNSRQFGGGGFSTSLSDIGRLPEAQQAEAFAAVRERIGWIISATRFSRKRHLFFPVCDASLYAIVMELLAQQPAASRPFVHLATWWDPERLPNRERFPSLERLGSAIQQLNNERVSTFLYAWTRPLAQRMSSAFGIPVVPLETPPEISLAAPGDSAPGRLTVGFLSAPTTVNGFENLPHVIRTVNAALPNPRQVRFVVQVRPGTGSGPASDDILTTRAELAALPDRNVSMIDEVLDRPIYFAAMQQIDALLIPVRGMTEHHSVAALHAMAAGKLVLTLDGTSFAGTVKNRVVAAPSVEALAELIRHAAEDPKAIRQAARLARSTFWSTVRPSRMFAQLLYGPLIIGGAEGSSSI